MLMTTHSFVQRPLKLLRWLGLLCCGLAPSVTLAATLHAIIITDTSDPSLHADQDRDNLKQLVANIHEATGLESNSTVIEVVPHSGYEKVKNAVTDLPVTAEDVVIFYYVGHGVNTDKPNIPWPAMAVEGEGIDTKDDKLVELNWVKETLSNKSPRLLIAIADTCNEFLSEPSRGGGTILGEGMGSYQQAYRKLFLGYQGLIMAAGASPEQKAFSNQGGGRFTQQWLTSLKEELKSAEPDWNNIAVGSVKEIPVENSVAAARDQKVQSPQMEVKVKAVALVDGNEENEDGESLLLSHNQPPLKPDEMVCAQQSAGWGTCYLGTAEEGGRKWSVFVEEKVWFNRWHGWYPNPGLLSDSPGHYTASTSREEMTHLITLGARYEKISARLTVSPKHAYGFPKVADSYYNYDRDQIFEYRSDDLAKREELDITLSYSILPELQVGLGFKRMTLNYYTVKGDAFAVENNGLLGTTKDYNYLNYKIYGPTLNVGAQICLANLIGTDIFLFGNFSYGFLKTQWWKIDSVENSDYTLYHSSEVGVSWKVPQEWLHLESSHLEIKFGYRAQTIYTEAPMGDTVDNTEGFTLGLRLIF